MEEHKSRTEDFSSAIERALLDHDVLSLLVALESTAPEARVAAAHALGRVGGDKARLALVRLARDRYGERPDVRVAALEALDNILDSERYPAFLEGFIVDENRKVLAAARSMLETADPAGYPRRLVGMGCLDKAAMNVYGRTGEKTAVPLLASFLDERAERGDIATTSVWGKVYTAARALGSIGGREASDALEKLVFLLEGQDPAPEGFLVGERIEKMRLAARDSLAHSREK